ncbi:MAG: 2,4-diaminopentanoate dehydrogenase [Bacillota bacterium]
MRRKSVALWGFGAMGQGIAKMIDSKEGVEIAGICDTNPSFEGKSLGDILSTINKNRDLPIQNDIDIVLNKDLDLVLIATDSFVKKTYSKIEKIVEKGINVISTAEEMAYPYASESDLANKIDELAIKNNVTVLGTGINPGFVMDLLPIFMSAAMEHVEKIEVTRVNSLSPFGKTVMEEQGVGLTLEAFNSKRKLNELAGHVGFKESVYMMAEALNIEIEAFSQKMEPIVTKVDRKSPYGEALKGTVAGINMTAEATVNGKPFIIMKHPQQIEPGAEGIETGDYVTLHGSPEIKLSIKPEIEGGIGTVAMCVNSIPSVIEADPGLKTMIDLPVPRAISK